MIYQTEGAGRLFKITATGVSGIAGHGQVTLHRGDSLVMRLQLNAHGGFALWPSSWDETSHEEVVYFTQNQPLTFDCTPNVGASFFCVDDKEHVYLVAMPKGIKVYANADHDYANRGQSGEI